MQGPTPTRKMQLFSLPLRASTTTWLRRWIANAAPPHRSNRLIRRRDECRGKEDGVERAGGRGVACIDARRAVMAGAPETPANPRKVGRLPGRLTPLLC